jgi:apolipoprotein D and lipocalin family protein
VNRFLAIILSFGLLLSCSQANAAPDPSSDNNPLQTVSHVDLPRYMGTWYEIGRTYNRFEAHCTGDVKVYYELLPDGRMGLKNECQLRDGKKDTAHGRANIVDTVSKAKLRVTFFWPFYADYWIIDLDPDYRYAVVGEPDRKYLWIISRTPQLDPQTYDTILRHIAAAGYDISKVMKTNQSEAVSAH